MQKLFLRHAVILIIFLYDQSAYAGKLPLNPSAADREQRIDDVVEACVQKSRMTEEQDPICDALFTMKQIGDDSIEFIKMYFKLSPRTYAFLTVANAATTGRIRFKTKCFWLDKTDEIYDFKPGEFFYTIERRF